MVIAILNQKGGSGKTTLTINLGCAYLQAGARVLIADADPQASALAWVDAYRGDGERPAVVGVDREGFDADVAAVKPAFDVVIIDGAPRMDSRSRAAIRAADLVAVPVQPSAFDLWATGALLAMIRERQEQTGSAPRAVFVVSRAITGTRLSGEATEALAQLGLPVARQAITQRVAYAEAAGLGLSVLDYEPAGKAAEEIRALAAELKHHGQASQPR